MRLWQSAFPRVKNCSTGQAEKAARASAPRMWLQRCVPSASLQDELQYSAPAPQPQFAVPSVLQCNWHASQSMRGTMLSPSGSRVLSSHARTSAARPQASFQDRYSPAHGRRWRNLAAWTPTHCYTGLTRDVSLFPSLEQTAPASARQPVTRIKSNLRSAMALRQLQPRLLMATAAPSV